MIKAIFFDVDDTLIAHTSGTIPEGTRRALGELRRKGILTVVATGRHMAEFEFLPVKDIAFDAYITNNGQICLDAEKTVFWGDPVDDMAAALLVKLFQQKTIPVVLVEQDRLYINFVNDTVRRAQTDISSPLPPISEYRGGKIYQATMYASAEQASLISGRLPGVKITRWNQNGIDIVPKHGGKKAGIKRFLELHRIKAEETMAFGDSENDIEMLEYAGIGVAMGNASADVQSVADYVARRAEDDGIRHALRHFALID